MNTCGIVPFTDGIEKCDIFTNTWFFDMSFNDTFYKIDIYNLFKLLTMHTTFGIYFNSLVVKFQTTPLNTICSYRYVISTRGSPYLFLASMKKMILFQ